MTDQEMLIRQAIAAEAAEAVDSRIVLAEVQKKRARKRLGTFFGVAGLTVAAAATAVIVPVAVKHTTASPGNATAPKNILVMLTYDYENEARQQTQGWYQSALAHVGEDGSVSMVNLPHMYFRDPPRDPVNYPHITEPTRFDLTKVEQFKSVVQDFTGVRVDHYVAIPVNKVGDIAQIVGGIEVCVRERPVTPTQPLYKHLKPGRQTISGAAAEEYLFTGYTGDQWTPGRQPQRVFLNGLAAKINDSNLDEVAKEINKSVKVDEGFDVLAFAERFRQGASVRTTSIPFNPETYNAWEWGFKVTPEQARQWVAQFLSGTDEPRVPGIDPPRFPVTSECT